MFFSRSVLLPSHRGDSLKEDTGKGVRKMAEQQATTPLSVKPKAKRTRWPNLARIEGNIEKLEKRPVWCW